MNVLGWLTYKNKFMKQNVYDNQCQNCKNNKGEVNGYLNCDFEHKKLQISKLKQIIHCAAQEMRYNDYEKNINRKVLEQERITEGNKWVGLTIFILCLVIAFGIGILVGTLGILL